LKGGLYGERRVLKDGKRQNGLGRTETSSPFFDFKCSCRIDSGRCFNFFAEITDAGDASSHFGELFHIFYPTHVLFSALATTAMFWQKEKKFFKAIAVGIIGSVGICGISDIFIPYLAGYLLGTHMHLHVCIVEHPQLIIPFLALGVAAGFLAPGNLQG